MVCISFRRVRLALKISYNDHGNSETGLRMLTLNGLLKFPESKKFGETVKETLKANPSYMWRVQLVMAPINKELNGKRLAPFPAAKPEFYTNELSGQTSDLADLVNTKLGTEAFPGNEYEENKLFKDLGVLRGFCVDMPAYSQGTKFIIGGNH